MAERGYRGRSVLFLVRGGENVPSCRFRAWQFRGPLEFLGIRASYVILEKSRNPLRQAWFHLRLIPRLLAHDAVVFQKLLEPGRLRFLRLFNRNLHYDFDDAMYLAPDGARFPATIRAAPRVIAGNGILAAEARKYNPEVAIVPTAIPMPDPEPPADRGEPPSAGNSAKEKFVLSWIGTGPNLAYLEPVVEALDRLGAESARGMELRLLTDKPDMAPRRPWITVMAWSRRLEEAEFRSCDVGLMPLPDTPWCAGKCACKALQYLSYGKPVITSPVGVNRELFAGGDFGRLAVSPREWERAVSEYRSNPEVRRKEGEAGRRFVEDGFALEPWAERLAEVLFSRSPKRGD